MLLANRILVGVAILLIYGCQVTKQSANVRLLDSENRPNWEEQINSGNVGFYDQINNKLTGLDQSPHSKGAKYIVPLLSMSRSCRKCVDQHGPQQVKLEFLVNRKGNPSKFYAFQSKGDCVKDAIASIIQLVIIPGKEYGQNKSTLVHLGITFQ